MSKRQSSLTGAALILATLLAYWPAVHGGFIWDDDAHVSQSAVIRDPNGLAKIWFQPGSVPQYYPLAHSVFWLEYRLFGQDPAGYHVVNILLHGISAFLVWVILRRLAVPGALLAAGIFALHPVEVESVAWITELKNCLSGAFYLTALLAYLRFSEPLGELPDDKNRRKWGLYFLATGLFAAALLTKTVTASLPAAIILILWWKRRKITWGDIWPLLPMLAVGVAMGLVTAFIEKHFVGAAGRGFDLTPRTRLLIAGRAAWFYAGKLFWPVKLTFFYPRWTIEPSAWWQYLFPVAAAALLLALAAARRWLGKGPLVAVLFFGGTLFPALGFVDVFPFVYSFVADHFQYLACLGLIALAAAALELARRRLLPTAAMAGRVAATGLLLALGTLTWRQAHVYHDLATLYEDTIAKNPKAWMAQNNLATLMLNRGDLPRAEELLDASLTYNPQNDHALDNLGTLRTRQGRTDDAIAAYYKSFLIYKGNPQTNLELGKLLIQRNQKGDIDNAVIFLRNVLELDPKNLLAASMLTKVLIARGQASDAVAVLRPMVALLPDTPAIHGSLAGALAAMGRVSEATAEYQQAVAGYQQILAKNPRDAGAQAYLADILAVTDQTAEALPHYEQAVQLDSSNADAQAGYAETLTRLGKADEALPHYELAVRLDPSNVKARISYAAALTLLGKNDQAAGEYQKVLDRDPGNVDALFNQGLLLASQNQTEQALAKFEQILRSYSRDTAALYQSGLALEHLGRDTDAADRYRRLLEFAPDTPDAQGRLAWVLATTANPELRNPGQALSLAKIACDKTRFAQPDLLDAYAAACARNGRFSDAITLASRALELASATGQRQLVDQLRDRIELYKAGQPYEQLSKP